MILLFGGSFDPFHLGHFSVVTALVRFAAKHPELEMEAIELLPCFASVENKVLHAPCAHRVAMLEAVIQSEFSSLPLPVRLNSTEIQKAEPQYTIDTLTALKTATGQQYGLAIGADQYAHFPLWKSYLSLLELLHCLVVVNRKDTPFYDVPHAHASIFLEKTLWIPMPAVPISSTDVRQRLERKQPLAGLLPASVEQYIIQNKLYGSSELEAF